MKIVGILIILFGVVDLMGSFTGFDLWGLIGIQLPDLVRSEEIRVGKECFY